MNSNTCKGIERHNGASRVVRNSKLKSPALKAGIFSAALLVLGGCGGGGGDGSTPSNGNPPSSPQQPAAGGITGKAIDGYLVNALVCVDLNSNGVCDGGEPSTRTDANGNYSLPVDGAVIGKKLVVMIDSSTKDLSRPNYHFPASFALSSTIDGTADQNVTPLTTMQQSLMEHGESADDATKAVVSFVGGGVNLKDDYIANGDSARAAFAMQVVDKVAQFAKNGAADADVMRGLMTAIVLKGGVDNVTQADVDAQAAKPVYATDVEAATALSAPVYVYMDTRYVQGVGTVPVRSRLSVADGAVVQSLEGFSNGAWTTYNAGNTNAALGHYQLKADGTWTGLLSTADLYKPLTVNSVSGNAMQLTDTNTGASVKLEFRRNGVGEKTFMETMSGWMYNEQVRLALQGKFAAGSNGLVGIQTRAAGQAQIDLVPCAASQTGIVQDGVTHCNFIGDRDTTYTSLDQLVGTPFAWSGLTVTLYSDGTATGYSGSLLVLDRNVFKWAKLAGNANVILLDMGDEEVTNTVGFADVTTDGKSALVLHGGRIQSARHLSGNVAQSVLGFDSGLFDALFAAVRNVAM